MAIDAPEVFTRICRRFHQDIDKQCPTIEAMADFAVGGLNEEKRSELSAFLDHVLAGNYSGGELKALWRRSPSDVYFRDGEHVRKLLALMKVRLAPERSRES
ncbi:hypothetical protein [Hyphomicrobium sp.]|uniref:hypothetical protein n=1 Tax=Hyphomicrobium sp. TaxID=82 RepID=UPI002E2F379C|nr:hypothetical protein [Hyphomicrobium sp.]HEX2843323.1 hypothetical protein [Hyphomicrobium sp.]